MGQCEGRRFASGFRFGAAHELFGAWLPRFGLRIWGGLGGVKVGRWALRWRGEMGLPSGPLVPHISLLDIIVFDAIVM